MTSVQLRKQTDELENENRVLFEDADTGDGVCDAGISLRDAALIAVVLCAEQ